MADEIMPLLQKSELFSGLDAVQLEQVVAHLQPERRTLQDGTFLYHAGDFSDCCWIIVSGRVTVQRPTIRHRVESLAYDVGDVTGLQGLVDPGSRRPVSLAADGDLEVIEIHEAGIARLDRELQARILDNVSRLLLKKLMQARTRIGTLDL